MTGRKRCVALGEVASFVRGITFKPEDVVTRGASGSVDCMRTSNVQQELDLEDVWGIPNSFVGRDDQYLRYGDILISSANSWNLVGKCCWVPSLKTPATFGGFVTVLRVDRPDLDPRYLYRWFNSPRTQTTVRSFGRKTTNISNLSLERCRALAVPLPPLEEQRRIADVLDRADALRAKRRAALALLDELTQSIFLDMVGDPVTNPRRWPVVQVADYVESFQGGKSFETESESAGAPSTARNRVIKISAVTSGIFLPQESKPISDSYSPPVEHFVRHGDLLISRANTSELVGAVALVDEASANLVLPDKVWRFVWRHPDQIEPSFVRELFRTRSVRAAISRRATGTSASMKNISQEKLRDVRTILPPVAVQREFALRKRRLDILARANKRSLADMDALFASLQDRAFRREF